MSENICALPVVVGIAQRRKRNSSQENAHTEYRLRKRRFVASQQTNCTSVSSTSTSATRRPLAASNRANSSNIVVRTLASNAHENSCSQDSSMSAVQQYNSMHSCYSVMHGNSHKNSLYLTECAVPSASTTTSASQSTRIVSKTIATLCTQDNVAVPKTMLPLTQKSATPKRLIHLRPTSCINQVFSRRNQRVGLNVQQLEPNNVITLVLEKSQELQQMMQEGELSREELDKVLTDPLFEMNTRFFIQKQVEKGTLIQDFKSFQSMIFCIIEPFVLKRIRERLSFYQKEQHHRALRENFFNSLEESREQIKKKLQQLEINDENRKPQDCQKHQVQ